MVKSDSLHLGCSPPLSTFCLIQSVLTGSAVGKNLPPANAGDTGQPLGWEDPLEEEMTTDSSILA